MFSVRSISQRTFARRFAPGCVQSYAVRSVSSEHSGLSGIRPQASPLLAATSRTSRAVTAPISGPCIPRHGFSSTALRSARYLRFSPDPERPFDISKWDTGTKVVAGLVGLAVVYYVVHLERVPETGRLRFMDTSAKYEAKLAEAARIELLQTFKGQMLPPDHPLTIQITRIVARLLESSDLGTVKSDYLSPSHADDVFWQPDDKPRGDVIPGSGTKEWTVMVVNDPNMVNAMALFGNVVVFTGILPVCQDEHGVAAVLGHEIGHVVARHSSERYSYVKVFIAIGLLLEALGLDIGLARLLTTYLMELPNSRTQELEADEIGLRLMSKACFEPSAAPAFMTRLGKATGNSRHDFLNTHPSSRRRVERLEEILPDAYALLAASPSCAGMQERLQAFGETVRAGRLFS